MQSMDVMLLTGVYIFYDIAVDGQKGPWLDEFLFSLHRLASETEIEVAMIPYSCWHEYAKRCL